MDELVSLCRKCHKKAEDFYDPAVTPWAIDKVKPEGNNFMAAMRVDAITIAPMVYGYLKEVRGSEFESLMKLRQPDDMEGKKYWRVIKKAVNALCRKRYSRNCVEDRKVMMLGSIANHIMVISLAQIEHNIRNAVQHDLHDIVMEEYHQLGKWNAVSEKLGVSIGTITRFRKDDGTTFGPSLREAVFHYCAMDAAAGISPMSGFECLSETDYKQLNDFAEYVSSISGSGAFKGEYVKEEEYA